MKCFVFLGLIFCTPTFAQDVSEVIFCFTGSSSNNCNFVDGFKLDIAGGLQGDSLVEDINGVLPAVRLISKGEDILRIGGCLSNYQNDSIYMSFTVVQSPCCCLDFKSVSKIKYDINLGSYFIDEFNIGAAVLLPLIDKITPREIKLPKKDTVVLYEKPLQDVDSVVINS